ncbi:MAG: 2-C-methyl-D-erythritol 4-phosphate cytidylyltransferase [Firmicutes bacterium]|nr:2-C-methyl-D-erythritol 4-phosphate cytidylyltransferase [Bacillota bacterium]
MAVTGKIRKLLPLRPCGAVIVAAGNASRMGGIDKVMALLGGEPVIARTVRTFQECDCISEIVIVTREDLVAPVSSLCGGYSKVQAVITGGSTRQESVKRGLSLLSGRMQLAAVHDAARPLVTPAVIDRTVRAAHSHHAAAPAIAVKDTIKEVAGGFVRSTPDRAYLRAVQTPQVFDIDILKVALKKAEDDGIAVTDDCSAVEYLGMSVKIVEGDERNIKITTPMDLKLGEMLLEERT